MHRSVLASALAFALAAVVQAPAARAEAAAPLAAEMQPLVLNQSLLLRFAESSQRAIAVGERGHIAVSESRSDWRQVEGVPTRATLTGVAAAGDHAWAVGHDGTILFSADGGLTWSLQRHDPWQPGASEFDEDFDPTQGAPLLDVIALDRQRVIAIGAFSLMLYTEDAGRSWTRIDPNATPAGDAAVEEVVEEAPAVDEGDWLLSDDDLILEDEEDPHLNGIARLPDGRLFVVGERGSAFRSSDEGRTWERLRLPYDGSMFGVLALGPGHLLAYGLRGNLQETRDFGDSWEAPDSGTELSLQGGAVMPDGGVVLVGSNGIVLHRAPGSQAFRPANFTTDQQETPVLSAAMPLSSRQLLVAGEKGLGRFSLQ